MRITSFAIPEDTDEYFWEKVSLHAFQENIPVSRFFEIASANCPYMKIIKESMFVRLESESSDAIVYLYYAVEKDKYQKKVEKLKRKKK